MNYLFIMTLLAVKQDFSSLSTHHLPYICFAFTPWKVLDKILYALSSFLIVLAEVLTKGILIPSPDIIFLLINVKIYITYQIMLNFWWYITRVHINFKFHLSDQFWSTDILWAYFCNVEMSNCNTTAKVLYVIRQGQ